MCADGGSGARGGVGTVGAGRDRAGDAVEGGEGWRGEGSVGDLGGGL